MSKPVEHTLHSAPLVEFLNTLPSPLTTTLVALAPAIARVRRLVQILAWKASWEESCLFLASWWAVCLIPEIGLRYLLPPAVLLLVFRLRANPTTQQLSPAITEDTLQRAIADLAVIHTLLPSFPAPPESASLPPPVTLLRIAAQVYVPYLALTYAVRLRVLVALTGTGFIIWRARWAAILRNALWRSAYFRRAVYRAWSTLSGQPVPPIALSPQSQSDAQLASLSGSSLGAGAGPSTSVRFLFTVYENQRWWMGLDWTAALLPGERPSWCSASQQAAAPPSAFTLPAATTAYTPAPGSDGKQRLKRTARWRWEEPEWRVVVRREGGGGTSRVERPVPSAREESAAAASAGRILKAAGKMRGPSVDLGERREGGAEEGQGEHGHRRGGSEDAGEGHGEAAEDEEPFTDPDGWVYADNKWEGASCKGGMGKYTRYRRWTRIAVVTETVEVVGPGELGIRRDEPVSAIPDGHQPEPTQAGLPPPAPAVAQPQVAGGKAEDVRDRQSPTSPRSSLSVEDEGGSKLKQRLKAAVMGATGHS